MLMISDMDTSLTLGERLGHASRNSILPSAETSHEDDRTNSDGCSDILVLDTPSPQHKRLHSWQKTLVRSVSPTNDARGRTTLFNANKARASYTFGRTVYFNTNVGRTSVAPGKNINFDANGWRTSVEPDEDVHVDAKEARTSASIGHLTNSPIPPGGRDRNFWYPPQRTTDAGASMYKTVCQPSSPYCEGPSSVSVQQTATISSHYQNFIDFVSNSATSYPTLKDSSLSYGEGSSDSVDVYLPSSSFCEDPSDSIQQTATISSPYKNFIDNVSDSSSSYPTSKHTFLSYREDSNDSLDVYLPSSTFCEGPSDAIQQTATISSPYQEFIDFVSNSSTSRSTSKHSSSRRNVASTSTGKYKRKSEDNERAISTVKKPKNSSQRVINIDADESEAVSRVSQYTADEEFARRLQAEFDHETASIQQYGNGHQQPSTSSSAATVHFQWTAWSHSSNSSFNSGSFESEDYNDDSDESDDTRNQSVSVNRIPPNLNISSLGYEDLHDLGESWGNVKEHKLTSRELARLPSRCYKPGNKQDEDHECMICMNEYKRREKIRTLMCFHEFHAKCVDVWLKKNATCPVCRAEIILN